jgi:hypothetical protein
VAVTLQEVGDARSNELRLIYAHDVPGAREDLDFAVRDGPRTLCCVPGWARRYLVFPSRQRWFAMADGGHLRPPVPG